MIVVCRLSSNCPFIAYFLKKNYSLRQNILKNLRVWERSLTSVPICVYLRLIGVGTWLGTGSTKDHWRFARKEWPDAAPDSVVQRPVSSQEVNSCRAGVIKRWNSVFPTSGQKDLQRPIDHEDVKARWPDSGCIWSVSTGHVRSRFQRNWTSLESIGRWVAASGCCHRRVRLIGIVRI